MMLTGLLPANAAVGEEQVTLSLKNASLQKVFEELKRQTGYHFVYREEVLRRARKVDVQVTRAMLRDVLLLVFKDQPLTYTIVDRIIVIRTKETEPVLITQTSNVTDDGVFNVRGQVLNEKNEPVPGASVIVKNTKKTTVSNDKGEFSLNDIEENTVLVVSSVGYQTKEMMVKAGGNLNVYLKRVVNNLDEAVVVAYNTTTQRANTGAVTVVKGEQIATLPNRSFDKSLQGLVPGLLVTSGNGQPGSPPSNFVLRGIATGGQPINGETYRNPLIVVDGVPVSQEPPGYASMSGGTFTQRITNPLAQLNPSDIESISVLKDAAAVALYGSKASNGVLLVTTKKGKAGKTVLTFRHQTDIASAMDGRIKMLTQQEYLELLFEAYRNSNPVLYESNEAILADLRSKFPIIVRSPGDTSFYPQSNWVNSLMHSAAVTFSNEVSMSGGNANSNFYLNLEYTKQNGVVKKTGYDRKSIRFNYEHRPTTWIKLGLNSVLSHNVQNYSSQGEAPFLKMIAMSPLNPIRDINGNYIYNYAWGNGTNGGLLSTNPVAETELNINTSTAYRGLSRLAGEIRLLRNLSFSSSLGVDFMLNEAKEKVHPFLYPPGNISEQITRSLGIINTNIFQYNNVWNNTHSLNVLAGHEAQILTSKFNYTLVSDLTGNPNQDQIRGSASTGQGNTAKQTMLSYFGQVNYGFKEKYYLSGSIRSDGSSRFGKNNRFGTYWSLGAGWVVTAEPFMKKTSSWLNFLKLRGSMGPAGNSAAIADQLRFDPLRLAAFLNNTAVYYPTDENPGNPSIQWEQTFTWDAGLELRLLRERIRITADIYNRKTKNLIAYNITTPLATGHANLTGNVGDVKNSGIELSVSAEVIQQKHFRWNVTANWSRNQNKLVRSFIPRTTLDGTLLVNEVGYEYNSFYLREWAGVNPANGRPMWIDSTTGKPTEEYSAAKPKIVGKSQPDGFGSIQNTFSYKGLSLSIGIYYQYGSQVYLNSNLQNDGNGNNGTDPYFNQTKSALNRWQKPGDISNNPRRLLNGMEIDPSGRTILDYGTAASTRYLYDGDFIRLSNIGLAYDFPKQLIKPLYFNAARIYVQAHNLATWTKYSGQDPENVGPSGFGSIIYPQSRSFSVGLDLSF